MTKERKEQLSNRLVVNFAFLLLASMIMLYVRGGIMSSKPSVAYIVVLILGVLGLCSFVALFILGKLKKPALKNYSTVGLAAFIIAVLVYLSKFTLFGFYSKSVAVTTVYLAMLIYFIVMAIYTFIQLRKPLVKEPSKESLKKSKKKRK